jgi:hypothetical protein
MGLRGRYAAAAAFAALSVALPACGGDDGDGGSERPPMARPSDFPKVEGRTIAQLRQGLQPGPVVAPSVSVMTPGEKVRFGFGLFDRARKQIADAPVALYVGAARGGPARGPILARYESLEVEPQFQSESVKTDPDAAESVYVADLPFDQPGEYEILGVTKLDDRLVASDRLPVQVREESPVPDVGEEAPRISTPTVEDVGNVEEIETRVPPDSMHDVDYADVIGKKPIMLLFSTPQLCQQRVCGPVNDVTEQLKSEHEAEAAWIHMEIYKDNELEKGLREQVGAFGLQTEPWLFAIDAEGKVAARLEGAFSLSEAEAALQAATGGG